MTQTTRSGPLQNVTIIDCSMAYAGPFGTQLLADLGANVIKVEPPSGDGFRTVGPYPPDYEHAFRHPETGADFGMSFASVNRNKRSICLDLKQANDREILLSLCEQADAIVENVRAGVMDKLGVGYEVIRARNSSIVYACVRGYGDQRTGESPYADWPCLDVAGQSVGGVVEATGDLFSVAIADIYPGTLMALGLVTALLKAKETGEGDFVDVAMYDSMLTLLKSSVTAHSLTGKQPRPGRSALVPFGLFPTSDGRVAIAAPVEKHWKILCNAMNREDLIDDKRTATNGKRSENQAFTEAEVTKWTSSLTKADIVAKLGGQVPCGPANTIDEIVADPHTAARDILHEYQLPGDNPQLRSVGNPIKFLSSPTGLYQRPPALGEHSQEILDEFDITVQRSQA